MVHYRSVLPFHPEDPNALLAELAGSLPSDVPVHYFLYHRRPDEMRGTVLVSGGQARDVVESAVRRNPRLALTGPGTEQVHAQSKSLICFCSQPPFVPEDEDELLAELKRGLICPVPLKVRAARQRGDGMILWVCVIGNFAKEVVKFALREDPNLLLLQVEDASLLPDLKF